MKITLEKGRERTGGVSFLPLMVSQSFLHFRRMWGLFAELQPLGLVCL